MMLRRRAILAGAAALLLLATAPARGADGASANDVARFLAGLPPSADSPLTRLTQDSGWREHARAFDAAFAHVEQSQLAPIRAWSAANIGHAPPTVFYMFSGPDFLYADAFYPNANTYVLAGLEPIGSVPEPSALRGSLAAPLGQLRRSLRWLVGRSYFITAQMSSDLSRGRLAGTLPVLYVFLARSGKTIRDVTLVRLDEEGNVQPAAEPGRGRETHGVRIVFADADGSERTLYYFRANLEDGKLRNSSFLAFCEKLGPVGSFVKSASYLLHSGGFARVREFILSHSTMVVQDDTGIPLRYYDGRKWELHPFGHYVGPIRVFAGRYQAGYAALFRNARPIDFGIGYRWQPNQSNLLLAIKREERAGLAPAPRESPSRARSSDPMTRRGP